jgi:hypothetical protein
MLTHYYPLGAAVTAMPICNAYHLALLLFSLDDEKRSKLDKVLVFEAQARPSWKRQERLNSMETISKLLLSVHSATDISGRLEV